MNTLRLTLRLRLGARSTRPAAAAAGPLSGPSSTSAHSQLRSLFTSSARCPSCGAQLPTALPTCPTCAYIQPLEASTSYFALLGLTTSQNPFVLDTRELRTRFLHAQRVCHPDAWAGKGEREQTIASTQSSQLNKAYQTLLSPLLRAQYILAQHGLATEETEKLTEQDLIMQVMDVRESLEAATTVEEVESIHGQNQDRIRETCSELERLMGEKKWEEARGAAVKLKYWEGIENAVKEWKEP